MTAFTYMFFSTIQFLIGKMEQEDSRFSSILIQDTIISFPYLQMDPKYHTRIYLFSNIFTSFSSHLNLETSTRTHYSLCRIICHISSIAFCRTISCPIKDNYIFKIISTYKPHSYHRIYIHVSKNC